MNIPEKALEAAGGTVYDALFHYGLNGTEADNMAESALEAAFKIVAARIWDEGYAAGKHDGPLDEMELPTEYKNPYE